jgi:hypothetical protein
VNGFFQHRKTTGKKERKTKSIVRNSHNHRFSRREKNASKLLPFDTIVHQVYIFCN